MTGPSTYTEVARTPSVQDRVQVGRVATAKLHGHRRQRSLYPSIAISPESRQSAFSCSVATSPNCPPTRVPSPPPSLGDGADFQPPVRAPPQLRALRRQCSHTYAAVGNYNRHRHRGHTTECAPLVQRASSTAASPTSLSPTHVSPARGRVPRYRPPPSTPPNRRLHRLDFTAPSPGRRTHLRRNHQAPWASASPSGRHQHLRQVSAPIPCRSDTDSTRTRFRCDTGQRTFRCWRSTPAACDR